MTGAGFPIRTPSDHSSVDSSPRPIAASHVLHRLLVPRHPPCALNNLTTKMLASTVQFSTNNQPPPHHAPPDPNHPPGGTTVRDPAPARDNPPPPHTGTRRPVPSGPNSVPTTPPRPPRSVPPPRRTRGSTSGRPSRRPAELVSVPPSSTSVSDTRAPQTHHHLAGRGSAPPPFRPVSAP
jgi:hypothetical protein